MKVAVEVTSEVTDEQRRQIANVLDDKVSRRDATRAEMKEFLWDLGSDWEGILAFRWAQKFAPETLVGQAECPYPECTETDGHDGDHLDLLGNPLGADDTSGADTESLI